MCSHSLGSRALRARLHPVFKQPDEFGVWDRDRRPCTPWFPTPTHEGIFCHVLDQGRRRAIAILRSVLEGAAEFRDRKAAPTHCGWRQVPVGSPRHAGRGIVRFAVTRCACLPGHSVAIGTPLHVHLVQPCGIDIALSRAIVARVAVKAARMSQDLRDLGEGLGGGPPCGLRRDGQWQHHCRKQRGDATSTCRSRASDRPCPMDRMEHGHIPARRA
jgi:hypothetical protein